MFAKLFLGLTIVAMGQCALADDGVYVVNCVGKGFKATAKMYDEGLATIDLTTTSYESLKLDPSGGNQNARVETIFDLETKVVVFMGTELPSTKYVYLYAIPATLTKKVDGSFMFEGLVSAAQRPFNLGSMKAACTLRYFEQSN